MKEVLKYIFTVVTLIAILPLVLITFALFDMALSLWKIVFICITDEGDRSQGAFNRFIDHFYTYFEHFRF